MDFAPFQATSCTMTFGGGDSSLTNEVMACLTNLLKLMPFLSC
jgi:hypothetical protein